VRPTNRSPSSTVSTDAGSESALARCVPASGCIAMTLPDAAKDETAASAYTTDGETP